MPFGIETERERRLALASRGSARTRSAPRCRRGNDDWCRRDPGSLADFFCFGLVRLSGLVELFAGFFAVEPLGNLRLLLVDRRAYRGKARGMHTRMLYDILAERIMIFVASRFVGFGRFEPHVVPTEILKAVTDLAEALR